MPEIVYTIYWIIFGCALAITTFYTIKSWCKKK